MENQIEIFFLLQVLVLPVRENEAHILKIIRYKDCFDRNNCCIFAFSGSAAITIHSLFGPISHDNRNR